ncbi:hypothetical protein BHE90_015453 [Fusarium euwallaceae]|uniref:Uncharacterized protein n=2 Tax=Fusarium solani species complex TaxID=232080 RepID=A0A3M2QV56_9HYPO|nr:hypothetical protein CDV36_016283 [Fusarium kuroshium]RTE70153.1 hypothetical protein BHE90_015453 [Fusarium euwallaceae]
MSLWLPGFFDVDPSSRTRCLSFEQKKEIIDWQRPEPGQQDFTLQLGVTSTSWIMDLGSLWIKSILTTKPTLQIPMDKDRLQERAALSSPYHLSWASLRFAIGRLFSLDNHYLIRGWFSFVTGDTHSQLQPH